MLPVRREEKIPQRFQSPPPLKKKKKITAPTQSPLVLPSEVLMSPGKVGGLLMERERWCKRGDRVLRRAFGLCSTPAPERSTSESVIRRRRQLRAAAQARHTPSGQTRGFGRLLPVPSSTRTALQRSCPARAPPSSYKYQRKTPFMRRASRPAKRSGHFWKPLGTQAHPSCDLHAGSVRKPASGQRLSLQHGHALAVCNS